MDKRIIFLVLLIIILLISVWLWYSLGTPTEESDAPGTYEPFSLAVRYVVQFVFLAVRMPRYCPENL